MEIKTSVTILAWSLINIMTPAVFAQQSFDTVTQTKQVTHTKHQADDLGKAASAIFDKMHGEWLIKSVTMRGFVLPMDEFKSLKVDRNGFNLVVHNESLRFEFSEFRPNKKTFLAKHNSDKYPKGLIYEIRFVDNELIVQHRYYHPHLAPGLEPESEWLLVQTWIARTEETLHYDEKSEDAKNIAALINQLASKNTAPTVIDQFGELQFPDDWRDSAQYSVRNAYSRLSRLQVTAFPMLVEHSDDKRFSRTRVIANGFNCSVGDECANIIKRQVCLVGNQYKKRPGLDGKLHTCPRFFDDQYAGDYRKWWNENKDKTIKQMQIDVLQWRIEQEKKIGFPDGKGIQFLDALISKLAEISSK